MVTVKTIDIGNKTVKEFSIKLTERPDNKSKAYLGVGVLEYQSSGLMGLIREKINFFKDLNTYYQPKLLGDFMWFIYYLLWWIILINLSVAIFNMLPLGIFDGGRVFYLTILGITKSKKAAEIAYKISTYLFIAAFVYATLLWVIQTFVR
jgi:membrane-associated protease RseP (regulator of RpoE activity)